MSDSVYVIIGTGVSGTGSTDECLREIKQVGSVLIQETVGRDVDIGDIEVEYITPTKVPEITVFYYEDWDREGMLHMKEVHTEEFYLTLSAPAPSPNFYRRLEKRPYSGNCNLRF